MPYGNLLKPYEDFDVLRLWFVGKLQLDRFFPCCGALPDLLLKKHAFWSGVRKAVS